MQGSFLATTADAVRLGDAGLFSTSQPATSNLLSVSRPGSDLQIGQVVLSHPTKVIVAQYAGICNV